MNRKVLTGGSTHSQTDGNFQSASLRSTAHPGGPAADTPAEADQGHGRREGGRRRGLSARGRRHSLPDVSPELAVAGAQHEGSLQEREEDPPPGRRKPGRPCSPQQHIVPRAQGTRSPNTTGAGDTEAAGGTWPPPRAHCGPVAVVRHRTRATAKSPVVEKTGF